MSCPVIRTRFAALRTLPSSTKRTPRSRPTCFTSTTRPLYVKLELRAMTNSALKPGQCSDDVFHHAISEILLLGVAAHVVERQHGDGGFVRKGKRVRLPHSRSCFCSG